MGSSRTRWFIAASSRADCRYFDLVSPSMKVFAACDDFYPKIQSLPLLFLRISAPSAVSAVRSFGCGYVALRFKILILWA